VSGSLDGDLPSKGHGLTSSREEFDDADASDLEYDSYEPPPIAVNLPELGRLAGLAALAALAVSRTCTNIRKLTKRSYHENLPVDVPRFR